MPSRPDIVQALVNKLHDSMMDECHKVNEEHPTEHISNGEVLSVYVTALRDIGATMIKLGTEPSVVIVALQRVILELAPTDRVM